MRLLRRIRLRGQRAYFEVIASIKCECSVRFRYRETSLVTPSERKSSAEATARTQHILNVAPAIPARRTPLT